MTIEEETDKLTVELCTLYLTHLQKTYDKYPDGPLSTNVVFSSTIHAVSNILVNIIKGFEEEYRLESASLLLRRIIDRTYTILEQNLKDEE